MKQNDFYVSLRQTTKTDIDESAHQLPPDLGPFREFKVADWNCPEEWSNDGVFVAAEEGQPLWFDLRCNTECACLPSVQRLNPITGEPIDLEKGLTKDPEQNYLWLPDQQWIDGYVLDGKVYQFVVTKSGEGLAVNEFVLPKHMQDSHALGFAFFAPKNPKPRVPAIMRDMSPIMRHMTSPMWFSPLHTPHSWEVGEARHEAYRGLSSASSSYSSVRGDTLREELSSKGILSTSCSVAPSELESSAPPSEKVDMIFLAAAAEDDSVNLVEESFDQASMGMGGRIEQRIVTDNNTVDYYQDKPAGVLTVYLALPEQFAAIMKKGKRQNHRRKDKFVQSGLVGGVQVPLA